MPPFQKGQPRPTNAGRRKGVPNKATIQKALSAQEEARQRGYMLGLEAMREALMQFRALAAKYQPNGPTPDETKFARYMERVHKIGSDTAQYETPRLQATTLTANIGGDITHRLEIEIIPPGRGPDEAIPAASLPAVIEHEG